MHICMLDPSFEEIHQPCLMLLDMAKRVKIYRPDPAQPEKYLTRILFFLPEAKKETTMIEIGLT